MKTPDETAGLEAIKKQLEIAGGQEIQATGEQLLSLIYPAAAYTKSDGMVTWKSIFTQSSFKRCDAGIILDVSGASFTGPDGRREILLSKFVCLDQGDTLAEPINVLATARSEKPFFVTATHRLINAASDLQITIFSWDATGAVAPGLTFDWRCRAVFQSGVIIL
jgi:hypothetical protein